MSSAYSSVIVNDLTDHLYTDVMGIAFVTNKAYNCHNVERDKDSCITNDEERMRSGSDNVYEYPQPIPACPTHDKLTHTIGFNYIYLKASTSKPIFKPVRYLQPRSEQYSR